MKNPTVCVSFNMWADSSNTVESNDNQMRDILATKEYLMHKAEEYQTELDHIQRCIEIVDSVIKKSSFTRASALSQSPRPKTDEQTTPLDEPTAHVGADSQPIMINSQTVAHATLLPDELKITISDNVKITSDTPPLKTFFVDRIIGEMRSKDEARAQNGQLSRDSVITCTINEDEQIRDITVRNYRDKERADEIIKSISWSLGRMVENSVR